MMDPNTEEAGKHPRATGEDKRQRSETTGQYVKKGTPSWRPASVLTITDQDPNYVDRWEVNDPGQIQKALAEGWEVASGLRADKSSRSDERTIDDGAKSTSLTEYRELIRLQMPKELADERNAYFQEKSERQIRATKQDLEKDLRGLGEGAPGVRGRVVID